MPVTELNHYFMRANDLERTKDFYVNVLGFEVMPRPDFPFPGYWLGSTARSRSTWGRPACRTPSSITSAARRTRPRTIPA